MEGNFPDTNDWIEYNTDKSGYFQDFSRKDLLLFCKQNDTLLEVLPVKGTFVLKGMPVFRSKNELGHKAVQDLLVNFYLSRKELITSNYVLAFKQITEVVLKAMSPGINDPGTALNSIDYLSELLRLRMLKSDQDYITDGGQDYIRMSTVTFKDLLYQLNAPLRKYCGGDIIVVQKLGHMFLSLKKQQAIDPYYHVVLEQEDKRLFHDAKSVMNNEADLEILDSLAAELKS